MNWRQFQLSLDSAVVPDLWNTSNIIPLPKISRPNLNDLRPTALILLVMKTLKTVDGTGPVLDPLQFAYEPGKGVDDAKLLNFNI